MLKRIIDFCLCNPWLVLVVTAVSIVAAAVIGRRLPVDVFPELKVPRVVVQTEAGGLTAEEVEQFITIPVESAMNGLPGVKAVRSSSGGGLSFVWVDFDWDTDLFRARLSVAERLSAVRAALPEGSEPEITPVVSVTGEIMLLAVTAEEQAVASGAVSPLELRQLAEYDLRNRLMAIPGIGNVVVMGGRLPEFQVNVSQERLAGFGVTLNDVVDAARASHTMAGAGYLPHVKGQEIPLRQTARVDSVEELRRVAVPTRDGQTVRLGQVAEVALGGAPRRGSAGFNGRDAVVLSVLKAPGGNTLELTRRIEAALDEFERARLPKGVNIHRDAYRQADFIRLSIDNGEGIVRDAAVIVVLVLGLTLLRVRTTLITLLAMPLSLTTGLLLFPKFGLGINIMTLGGLAVAVGDVVDNAIIFVEIAWRKLEENSLKPEAERRSRVTVLHAASAEILHSVTFSTLIIILVFLPLLFLSGLEGQFFKPLGLAYLLVFAASLLVAITVTPVLCLLLFSERRGFLRPRSGRKGAGKKEALRDRKEERGAKTREAFSVRLLKALYRPLLGFSVRHAWMVCLLMTAVTAGALWLASTFGTSFLPPFHEDCYTVFVSTPPGSSLEETERATRQSMLAIRRVDGVRSVTRRTGRAERDEHAEPVSASELLVRVDLKADPLRLRREIEALINQIPGVATMIGYPMAHRISSVLSGTNAELAINVYGDDLATLRAAAAAVKGVLDRLPQVADARANREILVDTLRIRYRLEDLARAGLSLQDAGEQVSAAFNGVTVGQVAQNQRRWDIVVRLEGAERNDLVDVSSFKLSAPNGARVRLDEVADVFREEASNLIVRDNTRRKALISCNVAPGSNVGDLVKALRKNVEPVVHAMGCTVSYGGSYEAQQSASRRLAWLGLAIVLAIVLLLVYSLRSFKAAALVMVNLPLCLIGGILAVYLATPAPLAANTRALFGGGGYVAPILSVASLVGFVTVVGFVVRNGLLLLNRYRELQASGMELHRAIIEGSLERMVPIIMTSLTTIFGLVPIVLAYDKPGGELLAPLAIVQFGGLISATLLNLLVLPAAYRLAFGGRAGAPTLPPSCRAS
ncbi:MAG TPA: efflux RND transporter permease subunit [Kiritimatiellia bacterium]|nr:efflux RND transporter permease subunit [Kiritimatiellia bacterium]HPS06623.1 efflux RND transporter permease subunit [Kiritimatiellia bacterium]